MGQLVHTITVSQSERRPCIVRGKKALFHKWEDKCEYIVKINAWLADEELSELKKAIEESGYLPPQVEVFPHRETVAIVELEDGAVLEVAVSEVRFVDSIHKEYAFGEGEPKPTPEKTEGIPHPSTRRAVCSKCGVEGLVGRELCVHNLTEILCHECHLKQHETKERDRP